MTTTTTTPIEPDTKAEAEASTLDGYADRAREALNTTQEKLGEAYEATLDAVKKHPAAAAAIATGAAAAVAGAVYGATKLRGKTDAKD